LLLKDRKNGTGRIARLELGGEGMCEEVGFCTLLVIVQCVIDDELEVRGRGDGRVGMRHGRENESFVRARDDTVMASS
jgi:hypothetical protein